jgi:hypothetical protein
MFCLQFKNKQKKASRFTFENEKEVISFLQTRSQKSSEFPSVFFDGGYNIIFTVEPNILSIESALVNEFQKING